MQLNLKTKLNAYPKLAPGILGDYYTKEEVKDILSKYVEEAPIDGSVYGRGDQTWIKLGPYAVDGITVLNGFNNKVEIAESDLLAFNSYVVDKDPETKSTSKTLSFTMGEDAYVWFCCTDPISNIQVQLQDDIKAKCDYVNTGVIWVAEVGKSFHCYRLTDKIIKDYLWTFILTIDLQ